MSPDDAVDRVRPADSLTVTAVDGLPEVEAGDDLAALLVRHLGDAGPDLRDGDVLVVTSKVVSKAEGRTRRAAKDALLADETDRVVARRGPTTVVRTRHGLVLAGAGIDASNTPSGTSVLLPEDPDASARRLREAVDGLTGRNVGVVVSDTAGRAWRTGQTDIAVGAAGLQVNVVGQIETPFGLDHIVEHRKDVVILLVELELDFGLVTLQVFVHLLLDSHRTP